MHFDLSKYKVYSWKHPLLLHWILNPGLVVNELVLGQRVPKICLVEKKSDKKLVERTSVPCPHCNSLHPSLTWSFKNKTAFKNWFGLYCPRCGGVIPCHMNLTTGLVLGLTYPLWIWFKPLLRKKWLRKQPDRYKNLDFVTPDFDLSKKGWIKEGLLFGLLMFLIMQFIEPVLTGKEITIAKVLVAIPIWILGGLAFGYFTRKILIGKTKKSDRFPTDLTD